ncbi:MAG: carbon-nitrogen hydrolase family protein [Actinomycetota bacterium]
MRVGLAQTDPQLGDVAGNLRRCLELLDGAAVSGCALVVFPECALSGYMFADAAEAARAAIEVPGFETAALASTCARLQLHCVIGVLERAGETLLNTALLLGPGGIVGAYRKSHIACIGADCFTTPGAENYEVFETPVGRIGLQICYDWRFPEITRVLALGGAEIVAHPTNSPVASRELADYVPRTRAVENAVYFLTANRVGVERGTTFFGSSQVVDPFGTVIALADDTGESLILAEVELELAREKTKEPGEGEYAVRLFADRRPELYGPLAEGSWEAGR